MNTSQAYGLWLLVAVNSAIFILFAISFFHPQSRRDWRARGPFSAFLVALFTQMYLRASSPRSDHGHLLVSAGHSQS